MCRATGTPAAGRARGERGAAGAAAWVGERPRARTRSQAVIAAAGAGAAQGSQAAGVRSRQSMLAGSYLEGEGEGVASAQREALTRSVLEAGIGARPPPPADVTESLRAAEAEHSRLTCAGWGNGGRAGGSAVRHMPQPPQARERARATGGAIIRPIPKVGYRSLPSRCQNCRGASRGLFL